MSYKKFENQDIFYNTIRTKPFFKFKIYAGKAYLNNSTSGYVFYNDLNTGIPACDIPNSLDLSCQDNSQYIAAI